MAVLGEGGAPMRSMSHMGWSFGKKIMRGCGKLSNDTRLVMALKFSFGMTFCARTKPSR